MRGRWTALTSASANGHLRVVEVLIAAGADVAAKTGVG
jgi:ankyrin repeat protein